MGTPAVLGQCEVRDFFTLPIPFKLVGRRACVLTDTPFPSSSGHSSRMHRLCGLVTNKESATGTHRHSMWSPSGRHRAACGSLLLARVTLIREQGKREMLLLDKCRAARLPEITHPEDSGSHKRSHRLMKTSLQPQAEPVENTGGTDQAKIPSLKYSNSITPI